MQRSYDPLRLELGTRLVRLPSKPPPILSLPLPTVSIATKWMVDGYLGPKYYIIIKSCCKARARSSNFELECQRLSVFLALVRRLRAFFLLEHERPARPRDGRPGVDSRRWTRGRIWRRSAAPATTKDEGEEREDEDEDAKQEEEAEDGKR